MTKREEALAQIEKHLFEYSGLGPICLNDIRPELKALESAIRDEEAEEIAHDIASVSMGSSCSTPGGAFIEARACAIARIAARKGKG